MGSQIIPFDEKLEKAGPSKAEPVHAFWTHFLEKQLKWVSQNRNLTSFWMALEGNQKETTWGTLNFESDPMGLYGFSFTECDTCQAPDLAFPLLTGPVSRQKAPTPAGPLQCACSTPCGSMCSTGGPKMGRVPFNSLLTTSKEVPSKKETLSGSALFLTSPPKLGCILGQAKCGPDPKCLVF